MHLSAWLKQVEAMSTCGKNRWSKNLTERFYVISVFPNGRHVIYLAILIKKWYNLYLLTCMNLFWVPSILSTGSGGITGCLDRKTTTEPAIQLLDRDQWRHDYLNNNDYVIAMTSEVYPHIRRRRNYLCRDVVIDISSFFYLASQFNVTWRVTFFTVRSSV